MMHQQGGLLAVYKATLGLKHITPPAKTEIMLLRIVGVYIVNVYLPPTASPWNSDPCRTPMQHLTELLMPLTLDATPFVLLLGDFNARIRTHSCLLLRSSPDHRCPNEHRNHLLKLYADLGYEIMSGSQFQTTASIPHFTSFQHNGSTVIDLVLASTPLLNHGLLCSITVKTRNKWSDHAPLSVSLSLLGLSTQSVGPPLSTHRGPQSLPLSPSKPVNLALAKLLNAYTMPCSSIHNIYGLVLVTSPLVQVWLTGVVNDSDPPWAAGTAIYFF